MKKFVGALVMMLAVGLGAFAADAEYVRYVNVKYGYSVRYPKAGFVSKGELADASGMTLLSEAKDAAVSVKAEKNVDGTTLEYEYKDLQSPDDKLQLIYPGSQYFEIKGVRNGEVYFIKKILKGDMFYTLEIEYPEAKKGEYGEAMNGIAESFEVNPG
jgi:hypothetical protein